MSSQPWLYFDDTASEIEYSPSQDWASTTHARAETGLAVFNDTLTATASAQASIHIEFTGTYMPWACMPWGRTYTHSGCMQRRR